MVTPVTYWRNVHTPIYFYWSRDSSTSSYWALREPQPITTSVGQLGGVIISAPKLTFECSYLDWVISQDQELNGLKPEPNNNVKLGWKPNRCLASFVNSCKSILVKRLRNQEKKMKDHHNKPFKVIVFGESGVGKSGKFKEVMIRMI